VVGEDGTIWTIHNGRGAGNRAKLEVLAPGDDVGMAPRNGSVADQSNLDFQL
jgi:hypothetical protein